MRVKIIPIPNVDFQPVTDFSQVEKCKTCAYHTPSSPDEDEMTIDYWHDNPVPHRCHERRGKIACVGAMESCRRLGLMEEAK
jgi:hypothetical protein